MTDPHDVEHNKHDVEHIKHDVEHIKNNDVDEKHNDNDRRRSSSPRSLSNDGTHVASSPSLSPAKFASPTIHTVDNDDDTSFQFPGPPPLNYTLHCPRRLRYIALFFLLLFLESGVLPLILFYALRWGAHLSVTTNLAIITSLIGTVSGFKIAQRTYDLWFRTNHESRRPIGAGRYGVDAFHYLVNVGIGAFFVPLIVGSSLEPASVSTVALALPCFMLVFCIPLLLTGLWDRHLRVPFRVSSLPAHQPLPPLTYTITEDVVAVDGGGGLAFRQAWRHRYEASRVVRRVCRVTALVWGGTGCAVAGVLAAAAWTAPTDTAYGLGYGIPWLWAIVLSAWTVWYVRGWLARERAEWDADGKVHREVELGLKEREVDREVDRLQRMRSIAEARTRRQSDGGGAKREAGRATSHPGPGRSRSRSRSRRRRHSDVGQVV